MIESTTRTARNSVIQPDETICFGCGRLITTVEYKTAIPGTDTEKIYGDGWIEWNFDESHKTRGLAEYCVDCFRTLLQEGIEPGDHPWCELRDLTGISTHQHDEGDDENQTLDEFIGGDGQ